MTGLRNGAREERESVAFPDGLGAFVSDTGAYTTVAAAVVMLLVLALTFSAALAAWSLSRAGDVQASADAGALAGANVVSSYTTAATVADASILSLSIAGLCTTGVGAVALLIPPAASLGAQTLKAGLRMLEARNTFAKSVSQGLQKLETALPALVAANGARTCKAHGGGLVSYTGLAVAVPASSASEFPALSGDQIDTGALEQATDTLEQAADELARASERTAQAKEKAWLADCGSAGANMQERAGSLSGLSAAQNPDYASSITWEPAVGLRRARAYYRWRLSHEKPQGSGVEAQADSAARKVFYAYAVEVLNRARIEDTGDSCVIDVPLLPKNTAEMRKTSVYTDVRWPTTQEESGLTLHYAASCPGAEGAAGPTSSLAAIEAGSVRECPVCKFSIGDVGKVPAASTSISNGFEYHLRAYTQALDEYGRARSEEIALEKRARAATEDTGDVFEEALESLGTKRPRIAPPGRSGCVGLAVSGEAENPEELLSSFAAAPDQERRGALAAAVLAPEPATQENNVLSSFFSGLKERCGDGGAVGLADSVMDLWGKLLMSYGDIASGAGEVADGLLGDLKGLGGGALSDWLADRLSGAVEALGIEPVDLRLKKPVLTNTSSVLEAGGAASLLDAQGSLRTLAVGTTNPEALLEALGYEVRGRIAETELTLGEIPIPGTSRSIPLSVRLGDLV